MKNLKKLIAALCTVSVGMSAMSLVPVSAADIDSSMKLVLTDITASDPSIMAGEARVRVSLDGADGNLTVAQIYFDLGGDLDFKSVRYLSGNNDPASGGFQLSPNAAAVNSDRRIPTSLMSIKEPITVEGELPLFELTFEGSGSAELSMDESGTFITLNGSDVIPGSVEGDTQITASETGADAVTATVALDLTDIEDFPSGSSDGFSKTGVFVSITDTETGMVYNTELNNVPVSKGGNYDATKSGLNFVVTTSVIKGHTFDVSVIGEEYGSYTKTGVSFDEGETVDVTAADLAKEQGEPSDDTEPTAAPTAAPTAKPTTRPSTGGGGGGGGGGGSSSSGSTGTSATATPAPTASAEPTAAPTAKPQATAKPAAQTKEFTDLGSHGWASEAIYKLSGMGIISGTSETTYSPADNIRRGDFILILSRMLDFEGEAGEGFADVKESDYYYDAITRAKAAGIAKGGEGNRFAPTESITREDLITLAYRAFNAAGYIDEAEGESALAKFTDEAEIKDYARSAMAAMVSAGVITGNDANEVNPLGSATRAEVAVMCSRLVDLMK